MSADGREKNCDQQRVRGTEKEEERELQDRGGKEELVSGEFPSLSR